jgi:hypothetical protein
VLEMKDRIFVLPGGKKKPALERGV